jgi:hypothetical protein
MGTSTARAPALLTALLVFVLTAFAFLDPRAPVVGLPAVAAAIVFGGALLLGTGVTSRLVSLGAERRERPFEGTEAEKPEEHRRRVLFRESAWAAVGGQLFIGLGGVVPGILALLGYEPMTLTLVAMLALGVSVVVSGSTISRRVTGVFRH